MSSKLDFVGSTYYAPFLKGVMNQNNAISMVARRKVMLQRVLSELAMNRFKWRGLPEEINPRFLEKTLFYNALALFYKDERFGKFMVVQATPMGTPNVNDDPTAFNTYGSGGYQSLKLMAVPHAGRDPRTGGVMRDGDGNVVMVPEQCVPIWSNYLRMPDLDIIAIYANEIAEFDRSIEINGINARHTKIMAIPDNKRLSAREINRQIDEGQSVVEVSSNIDGLVPVALDLGINEHALEKLQIVRKGIWNECMGLLGIDNANQDKKERMVASEVDANDDQISNMRAVNLNARKQAAHQINERYGTKITVEYNSDIEAEADMAENTLDTNLQSGIVE